MLDALRIHQNPLSKVHLGDYYCNPRPLASNFAQLAFLGNSDAVTLYHHTCVSALPFMSEISACVMKNCPSRMPCSGKKMVSIWPICNPFRVVSKMSVRPAMPYRDNN